MDRRFPGIHLDPVFAMVARSSSGKSPKRDGHRGDGFRPPIQDSVHSSANTQWSFIISCFHYLHPSSLPFFVPSILCQSRHAMLPSFATSSLHYFLPSILPSFAISFIRYFIHSLIPSFVPSFLHPFHPPFIPPSSIPSFGTQFPQ